MTPDVSAIRRLLLQQPETTGNPTVRFAWRYVLTLAPLVCSGIFAAQQGGWWPLAMVAVVAGFTQNALGILMHEASHYFLARDRERNDRLANWLLCYPLMNTVAGYRAEHFLHHRFSGGADDPVRALYHGYRSRFDLLRAVVLDLAGITAARAFLARYGSDRAASPRRFGDVAGLVLVHGTIASGAWMVSGLWWGHVLLWLGPLAIVPIAVNRVRTIAEHHVAGDAGEASRTTRPGMLEYLTIAPYGYSHHHEHHALASIPYFDLARAHAMLREQGVGFTDLEVNPTGYLGFFAASFRALPWRAPAP